MVYFSIFINSMLLSNYVFGQMLGLAPFIKAPKNIKSSFFFGLSVLFIFIVFALLCYPLIYFLNNIFNLFFIDILICVLVNIIVFKIINELMKKYFSNLYNRVGVYFPIILFNSTLFGISFYAVESNYNFLECLIVSIGSGLGYILALILFSLIRNFIDENKLPEFIKGLPFTFISMGIISFIFNLLGGISNIF